MYTHKSAPHFLFTYIHQYTECYCIFSPPLKNIASLYLSKAVVQYGQDSIANFHWYKKMKKARQIDLLS